MKADRGVILRSALFGAMLLLSGWGAWQIGSAAGRVGPPPALPAPVLTAAPTTSAPASSAPARRRPPPIPVLDRSVPIKIVIPSIGLRAGMGEVGLTADGRLETPPYKKANLAEWYRYGPAPGEAGPAVIVGHVDSKKSVAVFYYLTRIRPGDQIEVTRTDRRTAVFTVDRIEQVPKTAFPTDRVYGGATVPALRLVTCGGRYDRARQAWLDNIIVFATMTSVRAA